MKITGKYERDENFTTVYTADMMYTIANNGCWGFVPVGGRMANGCVLTPDLFDKWKDGAKKTGTFVLD